MNIIIVLLLISFSIECALQPIGFEITHHATTCQLPHIQQRSFIDPATIVSVVTDPLFATKVVQSTLFAPFATGIFMKLYLKSIKKDPVAFTQNRKLEKADYHFEHALRSVYRNIGHAEACPFESLFFDKTLDPNNGAAQGTYLIVPMNIKKKLAPLAANIKCAQELGIELNNYRGTNLSEYDQKLKSLTFQQLRLIQEGSRGIIRILKDELEPLLSHEAAHILNRDDHARANLAIKTVVPATILTTLTHNIPPTLLEGHPLLFGAACFMVLYVIPSHLILNKIRDTNQKQELRADSYVLNMKLLINQFQNHIKTLEENGIQDRPTLTHPAFAKRIREGEKELKRRKNKKMLL